MTHIHSYDWNKLMEVVKFIEHEADFHPRWIVNYHVEIQSQYCTVNIGENTLGVDGTFWVTKELLSLILLLILFLLCRGGGRCLWHS